MQPAVSLRWCTYVAPFMGAWIEIFGVDVSTGQSEVAPFMGAWIEMHISFIVAKSFFVAPFMGAWIEIFCCRFPVRGFLRRTLHGCVD